MEVYRISPVGKRMLAVKGELVDMVEDIEALIENGETVLLAENVEDPLEKFNDVEAIDAEVITSE